MANRFEVGDKVRIIDTKVYDGAKDALRSVWPKTGDVGVVTGFVDGHTVVRFDAHSHPTNGIGDNGWRFVDEWLEIVASTPRFNVGDKVRLTCKCHDGEVHEITLVYDGGRYVKVDGVAGACIVDEIEPYVETPKPKFAVGDKVRVVKADFNVRLVGRTATIVELRPYDHPPFVAKVDDFDDRDYYFVEHELEAYVEPAKPSFSVGDKVRVLPSVSYYIAEASEGAEGVVEATDDDYVGDRLIRVRLTKASKNNDGVAPGATYHYDANDLELIVEAPVTQPTQTFAVGDKAKLTEAGAKYMNNWTTGNAAGDVVEVVDDPGHGYRIKLANGDDRWGVYKDGHIEPYVEPAPAPQSKFSVGDRVRVVSVLTPWKSDYIGKVGTIEMIEDRKVPYTVKFDGIAADDCIFVFGGEELELIAPSSTLPTGFVPSTNHAHIDNATIERWVEQGVKNVEAQETLGFDDPSYTIASGDALLVVENGEARLYRLEATKDVE